MNIVRLLKTMASHINTHNYGVICKLNNYSITIAYFKNITSDEHIIVDELWRQYVEEHMYKSSDEGKDGYYAQFNDQYYIGAPKKSGDSSVLVNGWIKSAITEYREFIRKFYPSIYAKMDQRFPEPHIKVGPENAKNWKTLILDHIKLL